MMKTKLDRLIVLLFVCFTIGWAILGANDIYPEIGAYKFYEYVPENKQDTSAAMEDGALSIEEIYALKFKEIDYDCYTTDNHYKWRDSLLCDKSGKLNLSETSEIALDFRSFIHGFYFGLSDLPMLLLFSLILSLITTLVVGLFLKLIAWVLKGS